LCPRDKEVYAIDGVVHLNSVVVLVGVDIQGKGKGVGLRRGAVPAGVSQLAAGNRGDTGKRRMGVEDTYLAEAAAGSRKEVGDDASRSYRFKKNNIII